MNVSSASPLTRKLGTFIELSGPELAALETCHQRRRSFEPGAELVRQGHMAQTAYVLADGWVCSYKILPKGLRQIVDFQIPGDFLGLRSVLFRTSDHNAEAMTKVEVSEISAKDLMDAFTTTPRLATAVLWAASHSALAPMLALGIPGSSSTAVLLAALILLGIRPGPGLMTEQPDLVWGLMASMFIGNVVLLIINLPLAPAFASILRIPYGYLAPGILAVSLFGAYSSTLSMYPVAIALLFGLVGWLMMKLDFPRAPLVLALVLAPLLESSLRQSLLMSLGSPLIFLERPISAVLSVLLIASLVWPVVSAIRRRGQASA